jgi:Fic family protein
MDPKRFANAQGGRLIRTTGGASAFVPSPLPPPLELTWQLSRQLSDADRALGTLVGIARLLPNPHVLTTPFMRREAVLSSRIEGTEASFADLVVFEAAGEPETDHPDVREVFNYVSALEHGRQRLRDLPLSLRFIRELHGKLMEGVRGGNKQPGEFRAVQNWIGGPGSDLSSATYVPPPVPEMHAALDAFERYLHEKSDIPPLIRAALIHYQFEAIHPFLDGNGRIGRLLVFFVLHLEHVLEEPLLYLSAYFERNREEYYRRLLDVSLRGGWQKWIEFFLRGVAEQANDAVDLTRALLALSERYKRRIATARNAGSLSMLIDVLMRVPVLRVTGVANLLGISYPAAKKTVQRLVAENIVAPVLVGKRNFYIARGFVQLFE